MADIEPWETPSNVAVGIEPSPPTASRFTAIAPFLFVVLPILFGIVGFAGYIALAITLERQPTENETVLSQGQQGIFVSLPICTMIAASTGFALAFAFVRKRALSISLLFVIALMGWLVTLTLWNAQIAQYGRDASEVVLYFPPAGYAAASMCLGFLILLASTVRRPKRGEP